MKVVGTSHLATVKTYTYAETPHYNRNANFSRLVAKITLKREIGYHLVQTYIPTSLIVIVSWFSFFLDPTAVPARISLGFTTLLTLSTMAAGVRVALPPVAYVKAIDVWVGTCIIFVFLTLVQFAVVNSSMRQATGLEKVTHNLPSNKKKIYKKIRATDSIRYSIGDDEEVKKRVVERLEELTEQKKRRANRIDRICRFLFPILFTIFNILYWFLYGIDSVYG